MRSATFGLATALALTSTLAMAQSTSGGTTSTGRTTSARHDGEPIRGNDNR